MTSLLPCMLPPMLARRPHPVRGADAQTNDLDTILSLSRPAEFSRRRRPLGQLDDRRKRGGAARSDMPPLDQRVCGCVAGAFEEACLRAGAGIGARDALL